jgi:hypothetical protein
MEVAAQNGLYSCVEAKSARAWPIIAATLMLCYFCLSRAFAYVGIPPWKVFVSEVVLALFLLFGPKVGDTSWFRTALQLPALREFSIVFGIFFVYGILQVLHGILVGNPPFTALRDFAFNYYPLYIFVGLWAGLTRADFLLKLLRGFAWFNGIYGTIYLLGLNRINWFVPGVADEISAVPIFGQPVYSFVALLGIIAYDQKPWRSWHLLALNSFVMLGMQLRTEWLAFAIGLITWFIVTRQGKRLLQAAAVFALFFASSTSLIFASQDRKAAAAVRFPSANSLIARSPRSAPIPVTSPLRPALAQKPRKLLLCGAPSGGCSSGIPSMPTSPPQSVDSATDIPLAISRRICRASSFALLTTRFSMPSDTPAGLASFSCSCFRPRSFAFFGRQIA